MIDSKGYLEAVDDVERERLFVSRHVVSIRGAELHAGGHVFPQLVVQTEGRGLKAVSIVPSGNGADVVVDVTMLMAHIYGQLVVHRIGQVMANHVGVSSVG